MKRVAIAIVAMVCLGCGKNDQGFPKVGEKPKKWGTEQPRQSAPAKPLGGAQGDKDRIADLERKVQDLEAQRGFEFRRRTEEQIREAERREAKRFSNYNRLGR